MKAAHGRVFKYGDNVDTDVIIPARYLNSSDPKELATHCMEDIDKDFVNNVKTGDIMVANKNFGCGSSREHAPIAIKAAGVSCVIAETFARIFYRNAINIGLPIIECPEAAKAIEAGDEVEVDFDSGIITDKTKNTSYQGQVAFLRLCRRLSIMKGWLIISIRNRINLLGNLFQIIQIAPGDFKTGVDICVFLRGERIGIAVFREILNACRAGEINGLVVGNGGFFLGGVAADLVIAIVDDGAVPRESVL